MKSPTNQQKKIIEYLGDLVVIAKPGSGKTYVISEKIKRIIPELIEYKGIIAISFTNKASEELESRSLKEGIDKKSSFFGTIHKFLLLEIIRPFGKQIFGIPKNEIDIYKNVDELNWIDSAFSYSNLESRHVNCLKKLFLDGIIDLNSVGILALYIYDNSIACQNYLKTRYTHIIIDEYQDSSKEQHEIFLRLKKLGLTAIAVGDINQSIYAYDGRDSKYLETIAQDNNLGFKFYPLTLNHRCHNSIVNYSSRLINKNSELIENDDIRVFSKRVTGDETNIAEWMDKAILYYKDLYDIKNMNDIGILTRSNRTAKIINRNLNLDNKYYGDTDLDRDNNRWSEIFKRILYYFFDKQDTKIDVLEDFIDIYNNKNKYKKLIITMDNIENLFVNTKNNTNKLIDNFVEMASLLYPDNYSERSISLLKKILNRKDLLKYYKAAANNEVQIMTLHKAKGLEFDLVFHLDLYEWILPYKRRNGNKYYYPNGNQDLNLHYVGVTRAKKCCVLVTSSLRLNRRNNLCNASSSEFFSINNLNMLRKTSEI